MYRIYLFIVLSMILRSIYVYPQNGNILKYELINEGGVFIEKFDSANNDVNKYNENNNIYKVGRIFEYIYQHISKDNNKLYFKKSLDKGKDWEFVTLYDIDRNTIVKIRITVLAGNKPFDKVEPEYNQTVIKYDFLNSMDSVLFSSFTGLIENENNIWVHPPRTGLFKILEINPFPFVKYPLVKRKKWSWNLDIGGYWSDARWKAWEGIIHNQIDYKISAATKLKTKLGLLLCTKIKGKAKSEIGKTRLTCYFNQNYGFLKLSYFNIDKSKTILELSKITE